MKHYVTLIQNETTAACFAYDTKADALARYHHEMEYASTSGTTTLCSVMSASGAIIAVEKYTAPTEPEGGD